MDLREIDLNLLVVFNQLLLDRSVSMAAEKLGLTQPAVSNALKRLRAVLKDELFLRTSRAMAPTPYALHLAEPVTYALGALQAAFTTRDSFDPLTSTRHFQLVPNLGRPNLVHLNDSALLSNAELKSRDRVTIGQTTLLFVPLCGADFDWSDARK